MTEPIVIAILSTLTAILGGAVVKFIDFLIKRTELKKEAMKTKAKEEEEEDKVQAELALSDRDQMVKFMMDQRAELRKVNAKLDSAMQQNSSLLNSNFTLGKQVALLERDTADYAEDRKQWDRDRSMWYEERQSWIAERTVLKNRIEELETTSKGLEVTSEGYRKRILELQLQLEALTKTVKNGHTP